MLSSTLRMKQLWTAMLLLRILAGLGLDVVDLLDAQVLDRDYLLLAQVRADLPVAQLQRLAAGWRCFSSPTNPISSAKRARSEPMPIDELVQVVPVVALLALPDAARVDPDRVQQHLQILRPPSRRSPRTPMRAFSQPLLAPHARCSRPPGTRSAGRQQISSWVAVHSRWGTRISIAAGSRLPALDEVAKRLAVEADPPHLDLLRVGDPHLAMHVGQGDVEVLHHPGVLVVVGDLELDRQGAVRPALVLTDEAVGLQPAGKCRLGDDRRASSRRRPPDGRRRQAPSRRVRPPRPGPGSATFARCG